MPKTSSVYEMLSFQYKPIEQALRQHAAPEVIAKYNALPDNKKIIVLDNIAASLGL